MREREKIQAFLRSFGCVKRLGARTAWVPAEQAMSAPRSRRLFHYTTGEGLLSIVRSKSLHATHSDFLNDSSECRLMRDALTPVFEQELRELVPKLIERRVLPKRILDDAGQHLYVRESENIFRTLVSTTNRTSPYLHPILLSARTRIRAIRAWSPEPMACLCTWGVRIRT
jgi:hypothetical protein